MRIDEKRHKAEVWAREIMREIDGQLAESWITELPRYHGLFNQLLSYKVEEVYKDVPDQKREGFKTSLSDYAAEFEGADQVSVARDVTINAIDEDNYENPYLARQVTEGIVEGVMQ